VNTHGLETITLIQIQNWYYTNKGFGAVSALMHGAPVLWTSVIKKLKISKGERDHEAIAGVVV